MILSFATGKDIPTPPPNSVGGLLFSYATHAHVLVQALNVKLHFEKASERLYLLSDLHLLYLLTPFCSERIPHGATAKPISASTTAKSTSATATTGTAKACGTATIQSRSSSGFLCHGNWRLWNTHLNSIASDRHPTLAVAAKVRCLGEHLCLFVCLFGWLVLCFFRFVSFRFVSFRFFLSFFLSFVRSFHSLFGWLCCLTT